jgi:2-polyprenyl-3-methyl-5-hydroxy-6-metoxy-1,4-benzoquinol methylase
METLKRCAICGKDKFVPYAKVRGDKTGKQFSLVRCDACGFIFVNPRLDEKENAKLYDDAYFKGKGFDKSVDYVRLVGDNDAVDREGRAVIERIKLLKKGRALRILDIGCGTGVQLRALERAGYNKLTGLEFSPFAARIAKRHTHAKIIVGDFLKKELGAAQYDVIIATEVIEHIRDPMRFLKRVQTLLRPGGLFIYSTGNIDSLSARLFGAKWHYIIPEGHISYFSPRTMALALKRASLRPLEFSALPKAKQRAILAADDYTIMRAIQHSRRHNNKFYVRALCQVLALLPAAIAGRAVTLYIGKYKMPMAVRD